MMEATGGSKHDNESDLRQHVGVGARRVGCQGRLYRNSKCEREISGGVVNLAQESPTLRLSERGQEAARTSGEREFRSRQRETDDSFESIDSSGVQVHTEQRQDHKGWVVRGSVSPGGSKSHQNSPSNGCVIGSGPEGNAGDEARVPRGIGEEATVRFFKAKLAASQNQLEEAQHIHKNSQKELVELRKQSAKEQERARHVSRELQQLQQRAERENKSKKEEAGNIAKLLARVDEFEGELATSKKNSRQAETDKKSLEVRLHRALEEVSKLKEALQQARGQSKDQCQEQRMEIVRLEGQQQRLERQKMELVSAFKKQLKLIDVLKRQKFHVEAARVLAFTEEDFIKMLDWHPNAKR
ncbi:unnamed protein product [Ascophyllum nodosum]